jgi:succinylglutamate desuccinylase
MFSSIFGQAAQGLFGNAQQSGLMNQYQGGLQQQQAIMGAYNQARMPARWVVDGHEFTNAREFAKFLYPEDEQAQLMIVLKFGDV